MKLTCYWIYETYGFGNVCFTVTDTTTCRRIYLQHSITCTFMIYQQDNVHTNATSIILFFSLMLYSTNPFPVYIACHPRLNESDFYVHHQTQTTY